MGETRVDLLHLLEDLRDAYPGSIEETILTEIVANSLDSGATEIHLQCSIAESALVVMDNGAGMKRRDLARYHDIASSTKKRGEGIGFAGVGIKLGLLICREVVTESRRPGVHVATRWSLSSRHRAPWKWIDPPGILESRGVGVRLVLQNALSPLIDSGFVQAALLNHFAPLFDARFSPILKERYPDGVRFVLNSALVEPAAVKRVDESPLEIRLARRRKPSALGYLARSNEPLPESQRGVAISTLGKVIRGGWDWLAITPADPERTSGLIEVPDLAACLTLNKSDFLRTGAAGATYLGYRKAIQETASRQLALWGGEIPAPEAAAKRRAARPVERDLEQVLVDLADDFPLLTTLVERRLGGQRKLPIGQAGSAENGRAMMSASLLAAGEGSPDVESAAATVAWEDPDLDAPLASPAREDETNPPDENQRRDSLSTGESTRLQLPGQRGPRRPGHYGLRIQYERRDDDLSLGRLVDSTIWVNDGHPAYQRAVASRSEGYHIALAVGLALAPLAAGSNELSSFLEAFLARWGESVVGSKMRKIKREPAGKKLRR